MSGCTFESNLIECIYSFSGIGFLVCNIRLSFLLFEGGVYTILSVPLKEAQLIYLYICWDLVRHGLTELRLNTKTIS